jgi:hypothetical protein
MYQDAANSVCERTRPTSRSRPPSLWQGQGQTERLHYTGSQPDNVADEFVGYSILRIVQIVQYLLRQCETNHTHSKCLPTSRWMPKRVLEINGHDLRLVTTSKMETKQYATMSYCWGTDSKEHQLTKDNFTEYEKHISLRKMPTTIRDALYLVRLLNIRYVWIDAMCIVQDDNEDWVLESQKMHRTYSCARICISALQSRGSDAGLFAQREQPEETAYDTQLRLQGTTKFSSAFKSFPLNQRAWTLQERLLSTRLFHIAAPDFWFECGEGIVNLSDWYNGDDMNNSICSTGTFLGLDTFDETIAQISSKIKPIRSKIHRSWYQLLLDYCPRRLTFEKDRLVAIEGLKTMYQQYMGYTYFYGIWESDVYNGLLWFNGERSDCTMSGCLIDPLSVSLSHVMEVSATAKLRLHHYKDGYQARKGGLSPPKTQDATGALSCCTPSWSWAAVCSKYTNFCRIDGQAYFPWNGKSIERLRVKFHGARELMVPDVPVPCLELTGTVARLKITPDLLISECTFPVQSGRIILKGSSTIFLDKATSKLNECHALLFYESGFDTKRLSNTSHLTLLLLEKVSRDQVFKRIGLAFLKVTLGCSLPHLDLFQEKNKRIWLI